MAAVEAAEDRGLNRVLIAQATGTGKTTVFGEWIRRGDVPTLVVAHREELLDQAARRIRRQTDMEVGVEAGNSRAHPGCDVVVAGVQSIGKPNNTRLDWFQPKRLVIDEAHHAAADTYQHVLERFGCYEGRCFTLGVTATPHRLDNKPLHGTRQAVFQDIVYSYTLRKAIEDGYLVDPPAWRVKADFDLTRVKKDRGDYNTAQLMRQMNTDVVNSQAFDAWQQTAQGRKTIVFCVGVQHAMDVAALFRAQGICAQHVDGGMKKGDGEQRDRIMSAFRRGEIQVLTNVDICTEGFDDPETSCVLMLRPTTSWALYTQMIGRGLRVLPNVIEGLDDPADRRAAIARSRKPDCVIIDVVGNSENHNAASVPGIFELPVELDLAGHKVMEAVEKWDKMSEFQRGALFEREINFDGLTAALQKVDLLAELAVPDEIAKVSTYGWLKTGDDSYYLGCGGGNEARLTCDTLGVWKLWARGTQCDFVETVGDNLKLAFKNAETLLRSTFPGVALVAGREAKWREGKPSETQLWMLRKHKVDEEAIARMTKGQAKAFLDRIRMEKGEL